tara:strand:+ start:378 stop:1394 length:1017 start_codon:yes stop_codon:yes gene_type:complete
MAQQSGDIKSIKKAREIVGLWQAQDQSLNEWLKLVYLIGQEQSQRNTKAARAEMITLILIEKVRADLGQPNKEIKTSDQRFRNERKNLSKWIGAGQMIFAIACADTTGKNKAYEKGDKLPTASAMNKAIGLVAANVGARSSRPFEALAQYRRLVGDDERNTFNWPMVRKMKATLIKRHGEAKKLGQPNAVKPFFKANAEAKRIALSIMTGNGEQMPKSSDKSAKAKKFRQALVNHNLVKVTRQPDPNAKKKREEAEALKEQQREDKAREAEEAIEAELAKHANDLDRVAPIVANINAMVIALEADVRQLDDVTFKALETASDKLAQVIQLNKNIRATQ